MTIPYGLWESPLHLGVLPSPPISFGDVGVVGGSLYWTESRPQEKGRYALMCYAHGEMIEKFPFMNVHSKVHEYGGGAFHVFESSLVVFDSKSSGLYYETEEQELICLVQDPLRRFADFTLSSDKRTLVCVCEDHTMQEKIQNYLVAISIETKEIKVLHCSDDFYASPQFSPDGTKLGFLSWSFPHMPWEECFLTIGVWQPIGALTGVIRKGKPQESLSQFVWIDDRSLVFAADSQGFSQLYLYDFTQEILLDSRAADFSYPLWTLGKKQFVPLLWKGKKALLCTYCECGVDSLVVISLEGDVKEEITIPCTVVRTLSCVNNRFAILVGGSPSQPLSLMQVDLETKKSTILRESFSLPAQYHSFLSEPEKVSCSSSWDGGVVYGWYYPPKNPFCAARSEDKPPLILRCHGGPTAHAAPLLGLDILFWTSRGFGVLDVNYRGSSGHGRDYRKALDGQWGLLDVRDCQDLALSLVLAGKINEKGIFARGSSSGGMTALLLGALGFLKGCVSLYGVTNIGSLAQASHKFEQHYLTTLVGGEELYEERSPISYATQLQCPILCFHGEADPVVPLSQAKELCARVPSAKLFIFPGEGHGFRGASSLEQCLQLELAFYREALGLMVPSMPLCSVDSQGLGFPQKNS